LAVATLAAVAVLSDPRPPAEDVYRFPGLETALRGKLDALAWCQWAQRMYHEEPHRSWHWSNVHCDCYHRWQAWARLEEVYIVSPHHARWALWRLQGHIGPDLYYAGLMPTPAPLKFLRKGN
jgi:hypothetical protein